MRAGGDQLCAQKCTGLQASSRSSSEDDEDVGRRQEYKYIPQLSATRLIERAVLPYVRVVCRVAQNNTTKLDGMDSYIHTQSGRKTASEALVASIFATAYDLVAKRKTPLRVSGETWVCCHVFSRSNYLS